MWQEVENLRIIQNSRYAVHHGQDIGKIMNAVDECGLGSNTIIISSPITGGWRQKQTDTSQAGKGWLYKAGSANL